MDKLPRLFIKTSLIYLAISAVLGVLITLGPGFSFMHSHFALLGWVSFLLFGLTYQMIPQYGNNPLFSEKLGILQFWLANAGLIGLALSYPFMRMSMLKGYDYSDPLKIVLIFGSIEVISIFILYTISGKAWEKASFRSKQYNI
jgi:hypothetical protein